MKYKKLFKQISPLILYVIATVFLISSCFEEDGFEYLIVGLLFLIVGNQENSPNVSERTEHE